MRPLGLLQSFSNCSTCDRNQRRCWNLKKKEKQYYVRNVTAINFSLKTTSLIGTIQAARQMWLLINLFTCRKNVKFVSASLWCMEFASVDASPDCLAYLTRSRWQRVGTQMSTMLKCRISCHSAPTPSTSTAWTTILGLYCAKSSSLKWSKTVSATSFIIVLSVLHISFTWNGWVSN